MGSGCVNMLFLPSAHPSGVKAGTRGAGAVRGSVFCASFETLSNSPSPLHLLHLVGLLRRCAKRSPQALSCKPPPSESQKGALVLRPTRAPAGLLGGLRWVVSPLSECDSVSGKVTHGGGACFNLMAQTICSVSLLC